MYGRSRLFVTAIVATALLGIAVSAASAGRLSTSSQTFRATWAELTFSDGVTAVRCRVTMEGSYHSRTIAKVLHGLVGFVTRVTVARPCNNGTVWAYNGSEVNEVLGGTVPNTLPWHITYKTFAGTLPNILEVRLLLMGVRFLVRTPFGLLCNYRSSGEGLDTLIVLSGGTANNYRVESTPAVIVEGAGCATTGTIIGTGTYTVLNSSSRITVSLI